MSFWGFVGIALLAVVILSIIFAFFHVLIMLLPAVLVIAGILWLINHFSKNDDDNSPGSPSYGPDHNWNNWQEDSGERPKRKKVRDAHTKDVDK